MADDQPYEILSPTKIRLGPEARYWAEQYFGPGRQGLEQFGRYLLNRQRLADNEHEGSANDIAFQ